MDQIIHDLVDTQKIYARAILHFVKRCLQHSKTVRDSPIEVVAENKSSAKGSSPTAADTRKSPNSNSGIAARDNLAVGVAMSIDLHDLHLAETLSEINDHSLTQMNPLEMVQLQREEDLLLDIEISHSMLANFSSIDVDAFVPLIQIDDGNVYNSTDFISGIIDMNKSFFNPNIAEDTRRKYLFGCDQIV